MSEDTPPPLSDEESRRQRQAALHALAQSQLRQPAQASPANTRGKTAPAHRAPGAQPGLVRRLPSWLVIPSAVLGVAVIAGLVLHQAGRFPGQAAGRKAGPTTVVLAPALQGLACIYDVAWSPDGSQVTVLGYRDACPNDDPGNYNYQAGVLHIYSAATGRLLQTVLPDAAVLALPGIPLPSATVQPNSADADTSKPVIDYTHVVWSPDGKHLALTFDINHWSTLGGVPMLAFTGLVLVNADGTGERAALWKETSQQGFTTFNAHTALRWDTSTMSALPLAVQSQSGYFASLPPAESYSWSPAGQLLPGSSLTTSPIQTAPIGNPDGGRSFSIWQNGYVAYIIPGTPNSPTVTPATGVYVWSTALPFASPDGYLTWSADGRYVINSVLLLMIQHPVGRPNPSTSALQELHMLDAPTAPIHDSALQQVFTSLPVSHGPGFLPTDYVAWSPSGHLLAAIAVFTLPNSSTGELVVPAVSIYNCSTGHLLATKIPEANVHISLSQLPENPYLGTTSLLRWSADGAHLLVYSSALGTITIWGTGQLPPGS